MNGLVLPSPPRYLPLRGGRYDVSPALVPLQNADANNGAVDKYLFQFDDTFPRFRANKLACRREGLNKYVCVDPAFDAPTVQAVSRLMVQQLTVECPALFVWQADGTAGSLDCHLTGETLTFDDRMRLVDVQVAGGGEVITPFYADAWDALCCQVPEDMAVVRCGMGNEEAGDVLAALHICAPSHWRAEDKIGTTFSVTHAPVPGMEKSRKASVPLLRGIVSGGPFVRFTWAVDTDDRLNHHPDPPPNVNPELWNRRKFDPAAPVPLVFRVERQVLWPLPDVNAFVFAIRTHQTDAHLLRSDDAARNLLVSALQSMSSESRVYKGLNDALFADVLAWLHG